MLPLKLRKTIRPRFCLTSVRLGVTLTSLALLSACATPPPPPAPLKASDIQGFAIEHIYVSLDEPVFARLTDHPVKMGGQEIDEAHIITSLKSSFDNALRVSETAKPLGSRPTVLDIRVTGIDNQGPPYTMSAVAYLNDARTSDSISVYQLSAKYGSGGFFEKIGQNVAGTDIVNRLSDEMSKNLRQHMYPGTTPGITQGTTSSPY